MEWCCLPYHSLPPDIPTLRWVANVMLANSLGGRKTQSGGGGGNCNYLMFWQCVNQSIIGNLWRRTSGSTPMQNLACCACLSAKECRCICPIPSYFTMGSLSLRTLDVQGGSDISRTLLKPHRRIKKSYYFAQIVSALCRSGKKNKHIPAKVNQ